VRLLLDTHYLLWTFIEPNRLDATLRADMLADENEVYYSPISLWEIAIKFRLGKLSLKGIEPEEFYTHISESWLQCLHLENDVLVSFYRLPIEHRDPFDRLLVWQAIRSGVRLVSRDRELTVYGQYGLKLYGEADDSFTDRM
jgi:PIN domain nuclease of toxin-antitoxin system